ncbi:MAG: VWA domain-containing protein [Acidobacteriota bacterium]
MSDRGFGLGRWGLLAALFLGSAGVWAETAAPLSEAQREFLEDGPGWLLSDAQRNDFLREDSAARDAHMAAFLAKDPIPATPQNELQEGLRRRRLLVQSEFLSLADDRARLLFLRGAPFERIKVDCAVAFKPIEVWRYGTEGVGTRYLMYRPAAEPSYRLWRPGDSKEPLYSAEMVYWLQQWQEYGGHKVSRAFDHQLCDDKSTLVDAVTGIDGLSLYRPKRPTDAQVMQGFAPPDDLAAWAKVAAVTPLPPEKPVIDGAKLEVQFPKTASNQRMTLRMLITLPPGVKLQSITEGEAPSKVRVNIEGALEQDGRFFESFRVRFEPKPPEATVPLVLVAERALRPGAGYVVRLRVRDEVGGAEAVLAQAFTVPKEAQAVATPPLPEGAVVQLADQLANLRIPGKDSLILVPPQDDIVVGLWRTEALVTGDKIQKVVFMVGGKTQFERNKPPYSAELRLPPLPTELVVRVEGYATDGQLVAADEMVLNQPRGELRVRIVEPRRGSTATGRVAVKAEVVVPEGRRVTKVELRVNDKVVAKLEHPPWEGAVEIPAGPDLAYLNAVAVLEDGTQAEDVRFFNAPGNFEQVDVNLVELYTTVTDKAGRLVPGLTQDDFEVREDGRPQKLAKCELIENLPIHLGIVIDTSGSMYQSIGEARRAAGDFLQKLMTPRDDAFALAFSDRPELLMPRTSDERAVDGALDNLHASGSTALFDALVHSLYYFRGTRGRRAMVLLSDGDDTSSGIGWRETLDYARRSGVAIYTIGLGVEVLGDIRGRLKDLAEETGGRVFFVSKAQELSGVYQQIDRELRSQYLLAFSSDRSNTDGKFRTIEVKAQKGKLDARTIRGYYP